MSDTSKLNPAIDADSIVYRQGFAADSWAKSIWPESHTTVNYLDKALSLVDYAIDRIENVWFPDRENSWIVLSGDNNFRKELATIKPYKGNRKAEKPKYYNEIREYMLSIGAEMVDGIEADDRIAHIQCKDLENTCIVTIDKDLNMIPGWKFNPTKETFKYVTDTQAYISFFRQMLEGDTTDNIPGIYGIGPAKAAKAIPDDISRDEGVEIVRRAYTEAYKGSAEEALIEIAGLLWMQRYPEDWCPYFPKTGHSLGRDVLDKRPRVVTDEVTIEVEEGTPGTGDEIGTGSQGSEVPGEQGN